MAGTGALCPRCGGTERVQISETESRCADCGLGTSSSRLIAVSSSAHPVVEPEVTALLQSMSQGQAVHFETASFAPFGLDDRWSGLRSLGGFGSSNGVANRLSLTHGNPFDPDAALVRIETRAPRPLGLSGETDPHIDRFEAAQELLQQLWNATGRAVRADVRSAAFPRSHEDALATDPTGPWTAVTMPVDGAPTAFRLLADDEDDTWIGVGRRDDLTIGLIATRWAADATGLVTVTDIDPYAEGTVEVGRLGRRRASDP